MAITPRFLRFVVPALFSAGLALAACSSDSDDPPPTDTPSEGGSESSGGGTGGTTSAAGEAGTPPVSGGTGGTSPSGSAGEPEPGTGGVPTEPNPGTAGAGGTEDPGPTAGFLHGEELYEPCAVCHQKDLGGSGFYPNISMDTVNGIGSWTDAEIGKAILEGVDKDGEDLCAFMIPQPDMSEGDLADLIEYLRGMPANDRKITSACPL